MANQRLGSTAAYSNSVAYKLDSACNLSSFGKSGGIFFIEEGTQAYAITLPSVALIAYHATFILKAALASFAVQIKSDPSDLIKTIQFADEDTASATDSDLDSITYTLTAVAGDYATFISDGSNWYAHLHGYDNAAWTLGD